MSVWSAASRLLAFALAHMVARGQLGDRGVRGFRQDATIQPTRGMPLLARRLPIRGQNLINERRDRAQFRLGPSRVVVLCRHSIDQRLAHHGGGEASHWSDARF